MTAVSAIAVTASILVAAGLVAACSGSATGSDAPTGAAQPLAMVVARTGGFAGVNDVVEIAADGTAQVTSKTGDTRTCVPSPAAVERLRAIDLAAVGSATSKSPIADGFVYSVTSDRGAATAGEGANEGIRAAFALAAGEVVSSCLANQATDTQ